MPKSLTARIIILSAFLGFNPGADASTSADNRKDARPAELWKDYMHGIVDDHATPVDMGAIVAENPELSRNVAKGVSLDSPHKKSSQPVLKVDRSNSVTFPLPLPLDKIKGKNIRFFYWVKGNKTADDLGWHAPGIVLTLKDASGKVINSRDSIYHIHTAGTFPWHCYFCEYYIPQNAESAQLKFYNRFRGTAWFESPSWEIIVPKRQNDYSNDERQDHVTFSLAPNVLYDQMPEHLRKFANKHDWNFVKGGLPGQPYDITTRDGFRRYYFEKAKKCPEHMNHAILYMGLMYHDGRKNGKLPKLEDGWLDNFRTILMDDQDPATGYWHDGKDLSLGLTFHICNMFFRYHELKRTDREDIIKPEMGLVKYVPRAEEMIRQTLRQQSSWVDSEGKKRPASWNKEAYRYTLTPDKYPSKSYLGSAWDAIYMLRLAGRHVNPELQAEIYESVKEAFRYMLEKNVQPDGSWKQNDTDAHVTNNHYVYRIMEDVAWLERKIDPKRPNPEVNLTRKGDKLEISWKPDADSCSLRVYIAPKDIKAEQLNERFLAGVIQRGGHKFYEMDPFVGARKMVEQAIKRFGPKMELPPESSWQGKSYLPWKMRMVKNPLPATVDNAPLLLPMPDPDKFSIHATAASWYGEESLPVPLRLP